MFINYLKVAYRNLIKNRFYTLLNIIGLSVGLTGFLLILLYVTDELSYDRFHTDSDKIYRVTTHFGNESESQFATAPPPLADLLEQEIPEVAASTRLLKWNDFTVQPQEGINMNQVFRETKAYYAEPGFFDVFEMQMLVGSLETALTQQNTIVITESTAKKYFGDQPMDKVLGQNLLIGSSDPSPVPIVGIVEDMPANSHFHFDILCTNSFMYKEIFELQNWSWPIMQTYVRLNNNAGHNAPGELKSKLNQIVREHAIPALGMDYTRIREESGALEFKLQPITEIHLNSHLLREHESNGNITYVYVFSGIALLIIIIACINFINLATAKSATRAKEVGVRKTLGSSRKHLIAQFLSESFIICLISTVLAMVMVEVFRFTFNNLAGKELSFNLLEQPWIIFGLLFIIIAVSLLAGIYPAFYLSSFNPVKVLKGKVELSGGSFNFRSVLVVFQFMVSVGLIASAIIIYQQLNFLQNKNIGFEKENVLIIHNDGEVQDEQREAFKQSLNRHSAIINSSFSTGIPVPSEFHVRTFKIPSSDTRYDANWYQADEAFFQSLNLSLLEGAAFSPNSAANEVLLNEAAVKYMGLKDPVGKEIILKGGEDGGSRLLVSGVLRDFNFESFSQEVRPLVIQFMDDYYLRDYVLVKIKPGQEKEAIAAVTTEWKNFEPRVPLTYTFLDEDFDNLFHAEQRLAKIIGIFTGLAIFVACLGLLGLTAYTSEKRSKEIGIRKILGASVASILILISKQFSKLLLISLLLSIPLSWFMMQRWLDNFAYRIEIGPLSFLIAGVFSLIIAGLTISYQSLKAALVNPVESLEKE